MPLFAMVSGYLFFFSASRRTLPGVLIRQVQSLILPAFSWSLLLQVARICFRLIRGDFPGFSVFVADWFSMGCGYWFLWSMFWCSLVVIIVRKFLNDKAVFHVVLICALPFMPGNVISGLHVFMYPYFIAGYIWHRDGFDMKVKNAPSWLKIAGGVAVIVLWFAILVRFDRDSYIYTTGAAVIRYGQGIILWEQLFTDIFRWVAGFAGCCSVMIILKLVRPMKILSLVGERTIGIYIMSGYFFMRLRPELGGYIINFIEASIIVALCWGISVMISRNKILNKFLLGGR